MACLLRTDGLLSHAFVGGMSLPAWGDEAAYLGGYLGSPVGVLRCETVDLDIPASSEIVIEIPIGHGDRPRRPMSEFSGYLQKAPPVAVPSTG